MNLFGKKLSPNEILKAVKYSQRENNLAVDEPGEIGFMSAEGVAYLLRLGVAPDWNFDLRNLDSARAFYGKQCADNQGGMLSLELVTVDGAEGLQGIFKYRYPDNPQAMAYVGILWVPFMEACLQINVEAFEQGEIGLRESTVMMLRMQDGSFDEPGALEPDPDLAAASSAEELFKIMNERSLRVIPSDDEKWDASNPQHPLTLVRKNLRVVASTLKLERSMHSWKPFRKP